MRRGFLTLGLLFAGLIFARAAGDTMHISKPEVGNEITAVIEAQLEAFRADDVAKAYSYSAAGLRVQTSLPAFARMVRQNYPEIWRSTRAEFGLVRDDGATARLLVHVFTKTGDASYDYVLLKEEGGWRIGGVLRHETHKADAV